MERDCRTAERLTLLGKSNPSQRMRALHRKPGVEGPR